MASDETAFESLLERYWPGPPEQFVGASLDEIQELEYLSEQTLPPFYRWFLQKMGKNLGPVRFAHVDFSIDTITSRYRDGGVSADPRYLLIAWNADAAMPNHMFYDREAEVRDDALVLQRQADGEIIGNQFETLREMFAWRTLLHLGVHTSPCVCTGMLVSGSPASISMKPTLEALGFVSPIPTGPFCGLHEREDATLVFSATPAATPPRVVSFDLGGPSERVLRQILEAIGDEAGVRVEIGELLLDNLAP